MFLTVKRFKQDSKVSQSPGTKHSETFSNDLCSSVSSLDNCSPLNNDPFQSQMPWTRIEASNAAAIPAVERCTIAKNTSTDTSNSTLARLNFNTHTLFAFRVSSISQAHTFQPDRVTSTFENYFYGDYSHDNIDAYDDTTANVVRDRRTSSVNSQISAYDEDHFLRNAPVATPLTNKFSQVNSQESNCSDLDQSSASWNEEIFQNAVHNLDDLLSLSNQSDHSSDRDTETKPLESSPPCLSLTKTADSIIHSNDLHTTQEYNISFSSLNRSEFMPNLPHDQRFNGLQEIDPSFEKRNAGQLSGLSQPFNVQMVYDYGGQSFESQDTRFKHPIFKLTDDRTSFNFPEHLNQDEIFLPQPLYEIDADLNYLTPSELDVISQVDKLAYDQAGCRMI